ncbi:MAG: MFS transporter [Chloroflexi bacterium]|nr:MFS transporter [Chloroflexota bacterium]
MGERVYHPPIVTVIGNWAASLRFKDFRLLWLSTLFYSLATGMEQVSVGWLIFELTGSEFMVGVGAAARMVPFFVLGMLSGAIADRWDRRTLLRIGTLGASAAALVMALLLLWGVATVWTIIALVLALGSAMAFTITVRQTFTYDIVGSGHALNGLALGAMAMQGGGIVGSLVSGAVIEFVGPGWQFLASAGAYLLSAAATLAIANPGRSLCTSAESVLQNLVGYARLMREHRLMIVLMALTATTEVLGFTHMTLLPVFAKEVLHVGPTGLGVMTAGRQAGGLLGLWLLAGLGATRRKGILTFATAIGFGVGLMAFSLTTNIYTFLVVLLFVNACAMAVDTLYKALMQDLVPDEERGRAMGTWVLSVGFAPVGHVGVGALAGAVGAPGALLINGAVLAGINIATVIGLPRIRRME